MKLSFASGTSGADRPHVFFGLGADGEAVLTQRKKNAAPPRQSGWTPSQIQKQHLHPTRNPPQSQNPLQKQSRLDGLDVICFWRILLN
jgi:hypothetical protein